MTESVLIAVAAVNLITFLTFGFDKWQARRQARRPAKGAPRRRVPEAWLLLMSFGTGLLGGWLGMTVFRHKTKKRSFQVKMVLVSVFNLAWLLLYLKLAPPGET